MGVAYTNPVLVECMTADMEGKDCVDVGRSVCEVPCV